MAGESGNRIIFLIGFVVAVAAVVAAVLLNKPQFEAQRDLDRKRRDLQAEVDRQRREVEEINERSRRFKCDPEFVERQARINGRIRPGEIAFVFDAPE